MQYFNTSGTIFAFDYVIKQMFIREKITLVACKKMVLMSFGKKVIPIEKCNRFRRVLINIQCL